MSRNKQDGGGDAAGGATGGQWRGYVAQIYFYNVAQIDFYIDYNCFFFTIDNSLRYR